MAAKKKIGKGEIAGYVIAAIIGITGLVFIIFGIIGDHYQGLDSENWVSISENAWLTNWSNMGYRWWGLILLCLGLLITVLTLNIVAAGSDRDEERANRRKQRQMLAEAAIEAEAVDASNEEQPEETPKAE